MLITAEDTFTSWVRPTWPMGDGIDISIENPNGATVTIQRSLDGGVTPDDIATYNVAVATGFNAANETYFRVGVKTGDFGTAPFNVRIAG